MGARFWGLLALGVSLLSIGGGVFAQAPPRIVDGVRQAAASRFPKPELNAAISTDATELFQFWNAAGQRRVDVVAIGDSNLIHFHGGWDAGLSSALYARLGMYATGVVACGSINGNTSAQGFGWSGEWFPELLPQDDGAPTELLTHWGNFPAVVPSGYGYIAPGYTFNPQLLGIRLEPDCPIGIDGPLRFHLGYGTFPTPGGSFTPTSRYDSWPYSALADAPPVSTYSPAGYTMRVATLDLPAGPRDGRAVYGGFTRPSGEPLVGPIFATMTRCENTAKHAGVAFSSLVYDGGRSLRSMAWRLQTMTDAQFDYYTLRLTELQNGPPTALVIVNSGLNDRNETLDSVGPGRVCPGYSPQAFYDNLLAIKLRFEGSWLRHGYDLNNLYFLATVSHPIEVRDDPFHLQYRSAAERFARYYPRVASIRLDRLTNATELRNNGWFFTHEDTSHLSFAGFMSLGNRIINHLLSAWSATGDLDRDGLVGASDVTMVLHSWGGQGATATPGDANHDGVVDLTDLMIIIAHYGESAP